MKHLLDLQGWTVPDALALFDSADEYARGEGPRHSGTAALFFPESSLRTRVTFERGAAQMGLQPIVFPTSSLDKPEAGVDIVNYLAQWCDIVVCRHPDIEVLRALAEPSVLPVVNAMTDVNHPCEVLSDLYALHRAGRPAFELRYVFVGGAGNIGRAWAEAAQAFSFTLVQSCPEEIAMLGVEHDPDLIRAVQRADVILTDPPGPCADVLAPYRITRAVLDAAGPQVRLNPCPPFVRGREVDAEVVAPGSSWVGYAFKKSLLPVQQAVLARSLGLTDVSSTPR